MVDPRRTAPSENTAPAENAASSANSVPAENAAPPERIVVAAAILDALTHPTRVLCAQRSYPAHLAGQWELPGGKVDPGESSEAALHRELAEELGVRVHLADLLPGPTPAGDWPIPALPGTVLRVWLATLDGEDAEAWTPRQSSTDHRSVQWHGRDTLTTLDWLEADVPIAAALRDLLTGA